MQQFVAPNDEKKEENQSIQEKPVYLGVSSHSNRVDMTEEKTQTKKEGVGKTYQEEKGKDKRV